MQCADLDLDGWPDLAVTTLSGMLHALLNEGTGSFTFRGTTELGRIATTPLAVDLDGDEDVDLAVSDFVSNSSRLSVTLNDGIGHFGQPSTYYAGADGRASADDFDADGDIDVAVAAPGVYAPSFTVVLNNGDATFASPFSVSSGDGSMGMSAEVLDRDGDAVAGGVYFARLETGSAAQHRKAVPLQ